MSDTSAPNLIVVLGPTATGKTRFAACLAHRINGEIISADSRQVYRQMDLGTGKDYGDYTVEGTKIPYHLIDICEPGEKYHVHQFQKDFDAAFVEIESRQAIPILCGGTGMYIEAVTKGYRLPAVPPNEALRSELQDKSLVELRDMLASYKTLHNRSDVDTCKRAIRAIEIQEYCKLHPIEDRERPEIRPFYLGLQLERELVRQRIAQRLNERLREGLIEEVQSLLDQGLTPDELIYYGLEYKFVTQHIQGALDYDTFVQKLYTAICQFAKRQMTWFRRMERSGIDIHWIDARLELDTKVKQALGLMLGV